MNEIIEVKNLVKKYGGFTAVNGVSFEVHQGEIFGILGPNGAGKTTTLEMIEGLKGITSGSAVLDGHDVSKEAHLVKSKIGVQLQSSSFFDGLNLVELLEAFASLYGRKVDEMELLREVQLTEKAKNKVKELSGGQKQRFSIAVALVNDPKVLFLDEPTTGLDPQARRNLWELITDINKKGKTIVLTTHYMDEAEVLCNRIAVMDNAKIIALDTTQQLLKQPGLDSRIEFDIHKSSVKPTDFKGLPAVLESTQDEAGRFLLMTSDPQKTVTALFQLASKNNLTISDLQLRNPTLEDVFLKLTGHGLRE